MPTFTFPTEFAELLSGPGLAVARKTEDRSFFSDSAQKFMLLTDIMEPGTANACVNTLDRLLYPHLSVIQSKIPADAISKMTQSFSELLSKTVRVKTAFLEKNSARCYLVAQELGLLQMMRSRTLLSFAEALTGLKLSPDVQCQVICYRHGDYVGPHTDHYPEYPSIRKGYIDLHLMFSNSAVDHQWLVYEEKGHFSKIVDVNVQGMAVYKLPFWHYTTPLVAQSGQELKARRWVLLCTYAIRPRARRRKRSTR